MLNYTGKCCDTRQVAVTVIQSINAALKSCLEWLTMSYIISDSTCLLDFQCSFADRPTWISLEMYSVATLHHNCLAVIYVLILAHPHTSKAVLLHYVTPVLAPHQLHASLVSQ